MRVREDPHLDIRHVHVGEERDLESGLVRSRLHRPRRVDLDRAVIDRPAGGLGACQVGGLKLRAVREVELAPQLDGVRIAVLGHDDHAHADV